MSEPGSPVGIGGVGEMGEGVELGAKAVVRDGSGVAVKTGPEVGVDGDKTGTGKVGSGDTTAV